jgi:malonyl CoA-acyl carrier protein transacylase
MRVAFLYPGQGTRRPGMLHDLPGHPAVAATLAEAADLARSSATTVRWRDAVALLGELGTTLFIQAPPGHVLARMAAAAHPHARVIALAESGIADAALCARREQHRRAVAHARTDRT